MRPSGLGHWRHRRCARTALTVPPFHPNAAHPAARARARTTARRRHPPRPAPILLRRRCSLRGAQRRVRPCAAGSPSCVGARGRARKTACRLEPPRHAPFPPLAWGSQVMRAGPRMRRRSARCSRAARSMGKGAEDRPPLATVAPCALPALALASPVMRAGPRVRRRSARRARSPSDPDVGDSGDARARLRPPPPLRSPSASARHPARGRARATARRRPPPHPAPFRPPATPPATPPPP